MFISSSKPAPLPRAPARCAQLPPRPWLQDGAGGAQGSRRFAEDIGWKGYYLGSQKLSLLLLLGEEGYSGILDCVLFGLTSGAETRLGVCRGFFGRAVLQLPSG